MKQCYCRKVLGTYIVTVLNRSSGRFVSKDYYDGKVWNLYKDDYYGRVIAWKEPDQPYQGEP